jgi:hypothetical protein
MFVNYKGGVEAHFHPPFKEILIFYIRNMKIFQPQHDDAEDGYATSFTFDDKEEQQSFSDFLNSMEIPYLKSKFPVIEDGKVRYQIGFVVQQSSPTEQVSEEIVTSEQEPEHQVVEELKSSKKKVKSVN